MKVVLIASMALLAGCPGRVADVECVVDDDAGGAPFSGIRAGMVELFLPAESGGPLRCRPSVAACPALEGCRGEAVPLPVGATATLEVLLAAEDLEPDQIGNGSALVMWRPILEGDRTFDLVSDPEATSASPGFPAVVRVDVEPRLGLQQATLRFDSLYAANAPEDGPPLAVTLVVEGVVAEP